MFHPFIELYRAGGLQDYNVCENGRGGGGANLQNTAKKSQKNMFFPIFGKGIGDILKFFLKHNHKYGGASFSKKIMLIKSFLQNLKGGAVFNNCVFWIFSSLKNCL